MQLIPIIYHNLPYPYRITANIKEVAAHFDIERLNDNLDNDNYHR